MPIGKSKILDMDFGSFENTIDKNIETDKTSDKFDQQLQAYKVLKTEDIHPPKTGISVHFSGSLV